jgi:hypothetical protein
MSDDSGSASASESSRFIPIIARLEQAAQRGEEVVLSPDEVEALTWNAERVAGKYWETRDVDRSRQSVQNQLDRPRWKYLDQAPEARLLLEAVAKDAEMSIAHHQSENDL